ncbi:MAG: hypothetical protein ACRD5I_16600, partial [Candidatus Acidiferrales bacterium]
ATKLALALAGGLGYFGVGFDATAHAAPPGYSYDFHQTPRRPQRASNGLGKLNGGGRNAATEN